MWQYVSENNYTPKGSQDDLVKFGGSIHSYPRVYESHFTHHFPVADGEDWLNSHKFKMKSLNYQSLLTPKTLEGVSFLQSPESNPFCFKGFVETPKEDERFPSFYQFNAGGKTYFDDMAANFQEEVGTMNDLTARKLNDTTGEDIQTGIRTKESAFQEFLGLRRLQDNTKKGVIHLPDNLESAGEKLNNSITELVVSPFRGKSSSDDKSALPEVSTETSFQTAVGTPRQEVSSIAKNDSPHEIESVSEEISEEGDVEKRKQDEAIVVCNSKLTKDKKIIQLRAIFRNDAYALQQIENYAAEGARKDVFLRALASPPTKINLNDREALTTAKFILDIAKKLPKYKKIQEMTEESTSFDRQLVNALLNDASVGRIVPKAKLSPALLQGFEEALQKIKDAKK